MTRARELDFEDWLVLIGLAACALIVAALAL